MSKVSQMAKMRARPGRADDLIARFEKVMEFYAKEPGTEMYLMNRSKEDPDLFVMFELFTDADAYQAHRANPEVAAYTKANPAPDLFDMVEVISTLPVAAVGIPLGSVD